MEGGDWDPGPWKGHNFASARKAYDTYAGRSYDDAVVAKKSVKDVCPQNLETKCRSPLVIAVDVTGSMEEWPATIFEKLPLLDLEMKEYLDDAEISFSATGDAHGDTYPLQVQKFAKGTDLKSRLKELILEGGGGGQAMESYDLTALYYARKVEMPKAHKPLFIFIGDEGLYNIVDKDQAKTYAGVSLEKSLSTKDVMQELKEKYQVYVIRKLYSCSGDASSPANDKIQRQWESYLGADHVVILPEARRVVDVILGILAQETNKKDYFMQELTNRQTLDQVKTVVKALKTVHLKDVKALPDPGKSVIKRSSSATRTRSILDE